MTACERCGESNHDDARYCGTCGVAMTTAGGLSALVADDPAGNTDATVGAERANDSVRSSEQVDAPKFGETGETGRFGTAPPVVQAGVTAAPIDWSGTVPAATSTGRSAATVTPAAGPAAGTRPSPPIAPARTSRSASVAIALLAVAIVGIIGGIFIVLGSDPEPETARAGDEPVASPEVSVPSQESAESAPPDASTPSVGDSVAAETIPIVTAAVEPNVPVSEPAAQPAVTTTAPSPATSEPTVVPETAPVRGPGDLGLTQPILDEACDGRYITFVGSAVGDRPYGVVVDELLGLYPGTNYIWTKACPSLRQEFTNGADIYGVVYGPYPTPDEACSARAFGPADAYVRRISTTDQPGHEVAC